MFGIGMGEIVLILVIVLLVYGPENLPQRARKIGKIIRRVRNITDEVRLAVEREINRPDEDDLRKIAAAVPPPPADKLPPPESSDGPAEG